MTVLLYLALIILGILVYLRLNKEERIVHDYELYAASQSQKAAWLRLKEARAHEQYLQALAQEEKKNNEYWESDLFVLNYKSKRKNEQASPFSDDLYTPLSEDKIA